MQPDAKVVIVGAGISGLTAAVKLYEAGFKNVVILEARNRIGGRILTIEQGKNQTKLILPVKCHK